jgi:thiamine-phosphate pyrophosphorylase
MIKPDSRLKGVYVITDPTLMGDDLIQKSEASIHAGASIIQYRNKLATAEQQLTEASKLRELCRQNNTIFIINDDPKLAVAVDADGVHLGQADASMDAARQLLGNDKIIGISCNNRFEYAQQAVEQGADYIAFGRFFPSLTKPNAPQASTELLLKAQASWSLPIVAIGGITPQNGKRLIESGATMLAIIHGIFAQQDVHSATLDYVRLFATS